MIPRTTLKLKHIDLAGIKLPEASGGRREGEAGEGKRAAAANKTAAIAPLDFGT